MASEFLVCYDYGQGGVWVFMRASSENVITLAYPELVVVDPPPEWMTQAKLDELVRLDVGDLAHPFLEAIRASRDAGSKKS